MRSLKRFRLASVALAGGLVLLCGCGRGDRAGGRPDGRDVVIPAGAIAAHNDGAVYFAAVESRFRGEVSRTLQLSELLDRYRRATEDLVVEDHVLALVGGLTEALQASGVFRALHQEAVLGLYFGEEPPVSVSEEEVRTFYQEHRERFQQQEQRFAWHLFRRHADPGSPGETDAFLLQLKERVLAGEPFAQLAREYSHSETRSLGGEIGWLPRGQIAPRLDEALFALEPGQVSDPVRVTGGAVLLHAADARREHSFTFEEARGQVAQWVRAIAFDRRLGERVRDLEPPPGALVLEGAALRERLAGAESEDVVLEVGGLRLTRGEVVRKAAESANASPPWTDSSQRAEDAYRRELHRSLLYLDLLESGWVEEGDRVASVERHLRAQGAPLVIGDWLSETAESRIDRSDSELQAFFRDNRYLYESPLRLRLWALAVPAGADAHAVMARMEELREELAGGRIDLAAAAESLGTEVVDHGWITFDQLRGRPQTVRTYILDVEAPGYTVPFHDSGRLGLFWVEEREEPRPLELEEAFERVRSDFIEQSRQKLYRQIADEILEEKGFRFDEAALRAALTGQGRGSEDLPAFQESR